LVDDYSSDNSVNIIKEYISRYPSIKLYQHSNNLGVSSSRNTGLKYATADFITFLDCDDYISPNAFLRALEIFNHDEEIDLLIYKWEEFNENGLLNLNNVTKNLLKEEKVITNINDYPELIFATYAYIKVYSKRLVDYLEFPQILFEDNIVSARVMVNSNKIFIVDDITVYYRQHGNQITSEYSANKYLNVLASSKQIIDLREDYFEYYDVLSFLALRLLYHCIWYLTKYDGFSIKDGELVFHALKEFPKYFSHEIFVKYQNLFPNFLPCSEQTLWDIETMDFYEYVLKYRYQNEIKRLNDENSSLNNKITDFETSDSRLRDNISDLEKRNAELINKNTNLKKRIDQYKSRKIVRFVDKIKRAI
jgi:glycosyltransferase involved in cell wall biosynthesis